jgi:hypothetical protein
MVSTIPKHEPELRRAKGRAYAARCNEIATNYDRKTIHQFRPDRFEWICEQTGGSVSIKLRDKRSGAVANWPHWAG